MASGGVRVLYLSYDGMTDDIGQSQVLPYLLGCARAGHAITLVSFEKSERMKRSGEATREVLDAAGIDWRPERFRSSPPLLAKLVDQSAMARAARRVLRDGRFDLVHARSYIAGRGALAALGKDDRFLFDMRGFWADQRREGGRWRDDSPLGRFLYLRWKALEARMVARADHIVVLASPAAVRVERMAAYRGQPVSVIPCCADFDLFSLASKSRRKDARRALGIPDSSLVMAWLGSLGTVYRPDLHFRLFDKARAVFGDVRLLFLGRHDTGDLIAQAGTAGVALSPGEVTTRACARSEVPTILAAADVGTCFIVPHGSSDGVSPTKLAEMLACGIPVIANAGVGDVAAQIAASGGGTVLDDESEAAMDRAVAAMPVLLRRDGQQVRQCTRAMLDLEGAIAAYDRIYRTPWAAQRTGSPQ